MYSNYEEEKIYTKQIIDIGETNYKYSNILSKLKYIEHDIERSTRDFTSKFKISKKTNDNNEGYELVMEQNMYKMPTNMGPSPLLSSSYTHIDMSHSENGLNLRSEISRVANSQTISTMRFDSTEEVSFFNEKFGGFVSEKRDTPLGNLSSFRVVVFHYSVRLITNIIEDN
ncbi:hypothetical protein PCHCB_000517800 [Plasmodium chabaudi chabaudi]|uniref:Fam-b protein n=1 Tax=Plasmodium chabaudi chabaudi TaxID=31271 RepID=A0A1D3L8R8_PLACU|nr:hypothetical protein PCHCB_000517800 [Plasmodium chabaudi chabaudi]